MLNPPPPPPKPAASPSPEKKSKDKGGRDRSPSPPPDSPVEITDPEELARLEEEERLAAEEAAIAAQLVTTEQLAILVGMLPASQSGALHGSSALWLMANAGYVEILGDLGAVEALSAALTIATDEKKLAGNFLLQAIWSCAALWRLAHDPTNAGKALISAAPTLLKLLPSGLEEHDTLRKAALGCVSLMLKQPELQPPLVQMAAPGLLRDIAASVERPVEQRLTATRTLDEAVVTVGDKLLPPPPPPSSEPTIEGGEEGEEKEKAITLPAEGAEGAAATDGAGLELLMLSLLSDRDPELRALGCRGLARAAMRGAEKRIVDHGGCKALMMQLREEAAKYLAEITALPPMGGEEEAVATTTLAQSPRGPQKSPRSKAAAAATAELAPPPPPTKPTPPAGPLFRDTLNAVLNLSGAKCAQQPLAKYGLWTLVQIWYHAQHTSKDGNLQQLAEMASGVLYNLACHPGNRTLMYRAELQLKTAACSGVPLAALTARPTLPEKVEEGGVGGEAPPPDLAEPAAVEAAAAEGDGAEAPAASTERRGSKDRTSKEDPNLVSGVSDGGANSVKKRYINWLTNTMREVDEEKEREREAAAKEKAEKEKTNGQNSTELARKAFLLIDVSGDGELTRTEVIRAFRVNEDVRQLLLPILPAELLGKSNSAVSGVDVQAQVEAFEITFQRMDVDGSNAVTQEEFENYFTSIALHGGNAPPPRKKILLGGPGSKRKGPKKGSRPALHQAKGHKAEEGEGMVKSASGGGLPAVKGARAKSPQDKYADMSGGIVPMKEGLRAPGLQRAMQMSYIDTWRKPVNVPKSPQIGGGGKMPSPRSQATLRSGAAQTIVSARAELNEIARLKAEEAAAMEPKRSKRVSKEVVGSSSGGALEKVAARSPGAPGVPAKLKPVPPAGHGHTLPPPNMDDSAWAPKIEALEIMAEEKKGPAADLEDWQAEYLAAEESSRLRFTVNMPAGEEYTSKFKCGAPGEGIGGFGDKEGMGGKLVFWEAAKPKRLGKLHGNREVSSRIAEQLGFKGFELPNGKVLRLFHASNKRNWKTPPQEPVEPIPADLLTLNLPALPPHPHPPQPSRRDVQSFRQRI